MLLVGTVALRNVGQLCLSKLRQVSFIFFYFDPCKYLSYSMKHAEKWFMLTYIVVISLPYYEVVKNYLLILLHYICIYI